MESHVIVVPGLRTAAHPGWRAGVSTAVSAVARQPSLWLLGVLGFCLRGGILVLILPIIVLPTQVEARLIIGRYLGSTGFTSGFWGLLVGLAVLAALLTVGALLLLARIEMRSFDRLVADPEVVDRTAYRPIHAADARKRRLFLQLFGVQVVTFLALLACAAPVVWSTVQASYDEITRPSSAAPIYERVLAVVGEQLFFLLIALLVIEMISSLTSRELLVRSAGVRATTFSPLRAIATSALCWTLTAAVLISSVWALGLAWSAVRGAFLTAVSFSDAAEDLAMVLAAVGLSTVFAIALALAGFSSALRAALWSVDRLR